MKKLLFVLILFISFIGDAQTWKYSAGGSDFDGKYKISSILGIGNNYPYKKPSLVINKFDKEDEVNFYISGAGYFQQKSGISILWVFDNEKDVIYSTYDYSISSDGKILFLTEFNVLESDVKIGVYEFIEKLKNASNISLRVSDKYGKNDIKFSLRGSTKAIDFVVPNEELQLKIENVKIERQNINELKKQKETLLLNILASIEGERLSETSLMILKSKIEDDLGIGLLGGEGTGLDYKYINIRPTSQNGMFESNGYVDLFYILEDDTEKDIYGTWKVAMDSPLFDRVKKEKELKEEKVKEEKARLKGIISKYQIDSLKEKIFEIVLREQKSSYKDMWNLSQIQNVSVVISEYNYKKFSKMNVIILLDNNNKVNKQISIYSLNLTKKQLQEIGGTESIEF
jgi:hypothetical protein